MSALDGRIWRLDAGPMRFEGLDMRAVVRWPRDGAPATTDLTVYHPDPALVNVIAAQTERIAVLAGHIGDAGAVEIGGGLPVRRSMDYDRSSADMPLTVQLSSVAAASRAVLSASWRTTTARQVLGYIARETGLTLDDQSLADVPYARGYVVADGLLTVVAALAEDLRCRYAFDGPVLRLWPRGGVARVRASVWAPASGLMSASPSATAEREVRASRILDPGMRSGHVVQLDDAAYRGDLRVLEATHEIDTQGDDWTTTIVGAPRG